MDPRARKVVKEEKVRMDLPDKGSISLLLNQGHGLEKEYAGPNETKEVALVSATGVAHMITVKSDLHKPERRRGREPSNIASNKPRMAEQEVTRAKEKERTSQAKVTQPGKARVPRAKEKAKNPGATKVPKEKARVKARMALKVVPAEEKVETQELAWTSRPRRTTRTREESACRGIRLGSATVERKDAIMLTARKGIKLQRGTACRLCFLPPRTRVDRWDSP